jgi:hypothetical protein
MGICVLRRLLSVSETEHCGGGDDVITEVMMTFVIMIVVVILSLMVLVPVTAVVMALMITFFVLVSGLDKLSGPPRLCNWGLPHNYYRIYFHIFQYTAPCQKDGIQPERSHKPF